MKHERVFKVFFPEAHPVCKATTSLKIPISHTQILTVSICEQVNLSRDPWKQCSISPGSSTSARLWNSSLWVGLYCVRVGVGGTHCTYLYTKHITHKCTHTQTICPTPGHLQFSLRWDKRNPLGYSSALTGHLVTMLCIKYNASFI